MSALVEAGVDCRVLMAPVLPLLSDAADQLGATVRRIAAAGARAVEPVVLRLPPGTRAWYGEWLAGAHPQLSLASFAQPHLGPAGVRQLRNPDEPDWEEDIL